MKLQGLHHVTAITADIKKNFWFYNKVLGMRLIKKTVNFDDPTVYHVYYSDKKGSVGSFLTFFGYEGSHQKKDGFGDAHKVELSVPSEELSDYEERLIQYKYEYEKNDEGIHLKDPDGLDILLRPNKEVKDIKITGIYAYSNSKEFYDYLSFKDYALPDGFKFVMSDINTTGYQGGGSIHHVALDIKNAKEQEKLRDNLILNNVGVSPVMERFYFKSIYFREPSGLLLEVATHGPGMFVDEENPGSSLVLPAWLEKHRKQIEQNLVELE